MAISPDNFPYLQDFKEVAQRSKMSHQTLSARGKLMNSRDNIGESRIGQEYSRNRVATEHSNLSVHQGFSVGGIHTDSSSSSSQKQKSNRASDSGSQNDDDDSFVPKIELARSSDEEDSFAKDKHSNRKNSYKNSEESERPSNLEFQAESNGLGIEKRVSNEKSESDQRSKGHPSASLGNGKNKERSNILNTELRHKKLMDEHSLGPNDPPLIRKPFSKIY